MSAAEHGGLADVTEKAFYDCGLVKNHRAAVIMSPAGNGPGIQGLWIARLGLTRVEHEGNCISFPDSSLQQPCFDCEPGRVTASYWSRFIGFLRQCDDPARRTLGHYGCIRALPHMSFCAAGLIAMLRMRTLASAGSTAEKQMGNMHRSYPGRRRH